MKNLQFVSVYVLLSIRSDHGIVSIFSYYYIIFHFTLDGSIRGQKSSVIFEYLGFLRVVELNIRTQNKQKIGKYYILNIPFCITLNFKKKIVEKLARAATRKVMVLC